MKGGQPTGPDGRDQNAPFRSTLARVLLVQILALIALWLLQATYHG